MSRAIWKGTISFGLVSIPVALHTVEKPSHARVALHMYDKRDMAPVGNKLVNKETGEEITRDDVVKGFEAEGRVVVLTEEDLDSAKAEKNQQVEIAAFVDKDEIPVGYFDRPYYIEPQKSGRKGYALLRAALQKSGKAGIAKVVISTKQYLAAVYPEGDVLILELLRWGHEVKDASEIDVPPKDLHASKVTDKELDLAVRLVDEMVEDFEPEKYKDETRETLMGIVERRLEKGETRASKRAPAQASGDVVDIVGLLRRSLEGGKSEAAPASRRREPKRAHGTRAHAARPRKAASQRRSRRGSA
jgi:DNA end-binding protein Ku